MPHIDELLGVATFATAGLLAAIALQPLPANGHAASIDATSQHSVALVTRMGDEAPNLQCEPGA